MHLLKVKEAVSLVFFFFFVFPICSSIKKAVRSKFLVKTVSICSQLVVEIQVGIYFHLAGDFSCTLEVQRAIPILNKAYGDSMRKILHVGPDTCSVVSRLLKEEETEAWGVEPYDIEDADRNCKNLVRKGIVRVADIKFPLPYRAKSFSLVIVSDALDYLSPKYLNKTLPELARVSADGLVIFTGTSLIYLTS